jgi:hypothetical protein
LSCPEGLSKNWDLRAIFRKRGVNPKERKKAVTAIKMGVIKEILQGNHGKAI